MKSINNKPTIEDRIRDRLRELQTNCGGCTYKLFNLQNDSKFTFTKTINEKTSLHNGIYRADTNTIVLGSEILSPNSFQWLRDMAAGVGKLLINRAYVEYEQERYNKEHNIN
jgi:hypothetical protein